MATSIKCWPDGEPINSPGRFSSQPGVLIRRRNKLTTLQRCKTTQNEGQCVATVTEHWRRQKEQMQIEQDQKAVAELEWDIQPTEDLETRLNKAKMGDRS